MILSIAFQTKIFFTAILIGFSIGFLYDFLRIFRLFILHNDFLINIEDTIFGISISIVVFLIALFQNNGEIRVFFILGIFLGILLYSLTISKFFIGFSSKIIYIFKKIIYYIIKAVLIPINILLSPFNYLFKFMKKLLQKCNFYAIIDNKLKNGFFRLKEILKKKRIQNNEGKESQTKEKI